MWPQNGRDPESKLQGRHLSRGGEHVLKGANGPLWLKWWEPWGALWVPCLDQGQCCSSHPQGCFQRVSGDPEAEGSWLLCLGTNRQTTNKVWSHRGPLTWQGDCVPFHTPGSLLRTRGSRTTVGPLLTDQGTCTYRMLRQHIWTSGFRPHVFWKLPAALQRSQVCRTGLCFAKRCCFLFFITHLWVPLKISCKINYYSRHLVVGTILV